MQAAKLAIACHINANTYAARSGLPAAVIIQFKHTSCSLRLSQLGHSFCAAPFSYEIKTKTKRNGRKLSHKAKRSESFAKTQTTDIDSWLCFCCVRVVVVWCSLKLLQLFLAYSVTGTFPRKRFSVCVCVCLRVYCACLFICLCVGGTRFCRRNCPLPLAFTVTFTTLCTALPTPKTSFQRGKLLPS